MQFCHPWFEPGNDRISNQLGIDELTIIMSKLANNYIIACSIYYGVTHASLNYSTNAVRTLAMITVPLSASYHSHYVNNIAYFIGSMLHLLLHVNFHFLVTSTASTLHSVDSVLSIQ